MKNKRTLSTPFPTFENNVVSALGENQFPVSYPFEPYTGVPVLHDRLFPSLACPGINESHNQFQNLFLALPFTERSGLVVRDYSTARRIGVVDPDRDYSYGSYQDKFDDGDRMPIEGYALDNGGVITFYHSSTTDPNFDIDVVVAYNVSGITYTGMVWVPNMGIPKGSTITSCTYSGHQITAGGGVPVIIQGFDYPEDGDILDILASASWTDMMTYPRTTATVAWEFPDTNGTITTADFSSVLQELVDRDDWTPYNSFLFFFFPQSSAGNSTGLNIMNGDNHLGTGLNISYKPPVWQTDDFLGDVYSGGKIDFGNVKLPASQGLSISFWMNPATTFDDMYICEMNGPPLQFYVKWLAESQQLDFKLTDGLNLFSVGVETDISGWHHYVFTATNRGDHWAGEFFQDGKLIDTYNNSGLDPLEDLEGTLLVGTGATSSLPFVGKIKDFRIYTTALEIGQVVEIMNHGEQLYEPPSQMVQALEVPPNCTMQGGFILGGEAFCYSNQVTSSGGFILGGSSSCSTTSGHFTSTGGLILSSYARSVKMRIADVATGGIVLGGEALYKMRIEDVATGGIILGGEALYRRKFKKTMLGRIYLGGESLTRMRLKKRFNGGFVLSGTAMSGVKSVNYIPEGGFTLAGVARKKMRIEDSGTGGVVLGGESLYRMRLKQRSTGGVVLGGESLTRMRLRKTSIGGFVLRGSSPRTIRMNYIPEGGFTLSSTARKTKPRIEDVSSGGVVLGGEALTRMRLKKTSIGGVVLGGESYVEIRKNVVATGGFTLAGVARKKMRIEDSGTGGVVLGGEALTRMRLKKTMLGRIYLGGESYVEIRKNIVATGGFTLAGVARNVKTRIVFEFIGGTTLGGESACRISRVEFTPVGGVALGGESICETKTVHFISSGGVNLGGEFDCAIKNFYYTASGGVNLSGLSLCKIRLANESTGGVTLGDSSNYNMELQATFEDGFVLSGQSSAEIVDYVTSSIGGLTLSGTGIVKNVGIGGFSISGEAVERANYRYIENLTELIFSGKALCRFVIYTPIKKITTTSKSSNLNNKSPVRRKDQSYLNGKKYKDALLPAVTQVGIEEIWSQ